MIKLEDIEIRSEKYKLGVVYEARLTLRLRHTVEILALSQVVDKAAFLAQVKTTLIMGCYNHVYGDLKKPFYELGSIAKSNHGADTVEINRIMQQIDNLIGPYDRQKIF